MALIEAGHSKLQVQRRRCPVSQSAAAVWGGRPQGGKPVRAVLNLERSSLQLDGQRPMPQVLDFTGGGLGTAPPTGAGLAGGSGSVGQGGAQSRPKQLRGQRPPAWGKALTPSTAEQSSPWWINLVSVGGCSTEPGGCPHCFFSEDLFATEAGGTPALCGMRPGDEAVALKRCLAAR